MIEVKIPKDLDEYQVGIKKHHIFMALIGVVAIVITILTFLGILPFPVQAVMMLNVFLAIFSLIPFAAGMITKGRMRSSDFIENVMQHYMSRRWLTYEYLDPIADLDSKLQKNKEKRLKAAWKEEDKNRKTKQKPRKKAS
jgi:hypothetical protein